MSGIYLVNSDTGYKVVSALRAEDSFYSKLEVGQVAQGALAKLREQAGARKVLNVTIDSSIVDVANVLKLLQANGIVAEQVVVASQDEIETLRSEKTSQIFIVKPELKASFDQISGYRWKCIGKKNNLRGGEIFLFRHADTLSNEDRQHFLGRVKLLLAHPHLDPKLRPNLEYLDQELNKESFSLKDLSPNAKDWLFSLLHPAVEPDETEFAELSFTKTDSELGFGYERDAKANLKFIAVPSVEAFNANWKQMFDAKWNQLSPFQKLILKYRFHQAFESKGILASGPFIRNSIQKGVLSTVSNGREFIHDQMIHSLRRALVILKALETGRFNEFIATERAIRHETEQLLNRIEFLRKQPNPDVEKLDRLTWLIGVRIDRLWSQDRFEDFNAGQFTLESQIQTKFKDPNWPREDVDVNNPEFKVKFSSEQESNELMNYYLRNVKGQ